jgi:hypothetical protein
MRVLSHAWLGAVVLVLAAGNGVAVRAADKKDVTGDWKWEFKRQNGEPIEINLKLKQDGEKVTGTVKVVGTEIEPTEITDGKIKDGELSFQVTRERDGNKFVSKYKGKVEGDTIKGKMEFERNGETQSRDWEAKRAS